MCPEPFDASFGMRCVGRDELDAQLRQRSSELGRRASSGELFLERFSVRRPEDTVAVTVDGCRHTCFQDDAAEERQVTGGVPGWREEGHRHPSRWRRR